MVCGIKDLLEKNARNYLTALGLKEGDFLTLDEFYRYEEVLNNYQTDGISLYELKDDGVLIKVMIPEILTDSYEQSSEGRTSDFENANSEDYSSLLFSNIREKFDTDWNSFNGFMESSLLSVQQILKINDKNIPGGLKPELIQLRQALVESREDADFERAFTTFGQYLLEGDKLAQVVLEKIQGLKTSPDSFVALSHLVDLVSPYRAVVEDLFTDMAGAEANKLKELVTRLKSSINTIDAIHLKSAEEFSIISYDKILSPSRKEFERATREELSRLENHAKNSTGRIRETILAKIEEKKKTLLDSPNKEFIKKTLTGEFGDSSFVKKWIGAAITNGDIIVQGFNLAIKNSMDAIYDDTNKLRDSMSRAYDEFKKSTGITDFNGQEFLKKFLRETEVSFFNNQTGKIETYKKYNILHEHSNNRFTKISEYEARIEEAIFKKDKAAVETIKTEFDKYLGENFERPYVDEYYKAEELLGTMIGASSVRDRRKIIFDNMNQIKTDIKANSGLVSQSQIEVMDSLWKQYDSLRSKTNTDGTPKVDEELEVALILEQYSKLRQGIVTYEISEYSLLQFEKQKAEIDKITDKEAKARWYYYNTKNEIEPKWFEDRIRIENSISKITEAINNLVGNVKDDIQVRFKNMRDIANKYRDNNGVVNGRHTSIEEQQSIKDIEEQIKRLKKFQGLGLTEDQSLRLEDLHNKKETLLEDLNNPSQIIVSAALKEIKILNKEIKAIKTEMDPSVRALVDRVTSLMEELSNISMSTNTTYYEEEYKAQYFKFVSLNPMPDEFYSNDVEYRKQVVDGRVNYVAITGSEEGVTYEDVTYESAHSAFSNSLEEAFKKEDWFVRNHVEKWNGESMEMKPTYLWRHTLPTPEYSVKENRPNRNWSSSRTKPNPNYKDIDGKPVPKRDRLLDSDYSRLSEPEKTFINILTRIFLKAQEKYAPHDRLGYSIPIKEKAVTILDTLQNREVGTSLSIFKRKWTATAQDKEVEGEVGKFKLGDSSGEMTKFVPIRFNGKLDLNLVDTNFFQTIFEYSVKSLEYEALNETLPLLNATEKVLTNPAYAPKSENLNVLGRKFGILKRLKIKGNNERLDTIRQNANMLLFGEQDVDTTVLGVKWNKIFNNLMGYDAFKILAGSIPNQFVNFAGGVIQQLIRTGDGSIAPYSFSEWMAAHKEYEFKYSGQLIRDLSSIDKSYIGQLMEYFNVFEVQTDIKDTSLLKSMLSTELLMMPKNIVEHSLNATTFLAVAKKMEIQGMPLLEAFELRNNILVPKFPLNEENKEKIGLIRRKSDALIRDINGNYAKLDKTLAEKYWLGRAVFFMKKFIIPMVEARYGANRYSVEHGRFVEGYYRTWIRFTWNSKGRDLLTLLPFTEQIHLTSEEKFALRQMRMEILLIVLLYTMGSIVLGYDEEDKDRFKKLKDNNWFHNWILYTTLKARSEAETFVVPFGFDEIRKQRDGLFRELFPLFDNMLKIFGQDINYMPPGLPEYEKSGSGYKKGDVKLVHDLYKIIGVSAPKHDPIQAIRNIELLKKR